MRRIGKPFQPGDDPRRHRFTREECRKGYEAAFESLMRRYPGCDPHFLMCALIGSKPWYTLLSRMEQTAQG